MSGMLGYTHTSKNGKGIDTNPKQDPLPLTNQSDIQSAIKSTKIID